jgi:hypothetical protein
MTTIASLTPDLLNAAFMSILPRIERHGQIYFRYLKCRDQKADRIAEMVALCWKWFVRLAYRGKDGREFPTVLACFAARAVRCGRKLVVWCSSLERGQNIGRGWPEKRRT